MAIAAHCPMATVPRDASSVIIVNSESERALLIRRHANLSFAGGTWVFPGGKLEPSDSSAETLVKLGLADELPSTAAERAARHTSLGFIVAACRETYEETGIVLAHRPNGEFCDAALADSLQRYRADVSRDSGSFASLLADHGLSIDPARFLMWSHWITPSLVPKRFDTRFFVARMPPGQTVRCDSAEATELHWLDLRMNGLPEESFIHAPPTRFSLGNLALSLRKHGSVERLMQLEAARAVVPMMPKMVRIDGQIIALMPWDADYQSAPGEGIPPDAQIPAPYLQFPSRAVPPQHLSGMPAG
jgi:8-oxo-dGTP pyrophosphatase MutT (NUDIX family)